MSTRKPESGDMVFVKWILGIVASVVVGAAVGATAWASGMSTNMATIITEVGHVKEELSEIKSANKESRSQMEIRLSETRARLDDHRLLIDRINNNHIAHTDEIDDLEERVKQIEIGLRASGGGD